MFARGSFLVLFLGHAARSGLVLDVYDNTVLGGATASSTTIAGAAVSLPGAQLFSAEVYGTFSPPTAGSPDSRWSWNCTFENVDIAFVTVDGHAVCASSAAYNSSAAGMFDGDEGFRLLRKKKNLVVRMQLYHLKPSDGPATASVQWCGADGVGGGCAPLPPASLSPVLPAPEQQRRALQRDLAVGWGSWLHRDLLSVVLLPDAAVLTVQLCQLSTGRCLREAQIDANGGKPGAARHQARFVRVGRHAMDHSYSQAFVRFRPPGGGGLLPPDPSFLNVSIEYATSSPAAAANTGGGISGDRRGLDLLVTPVLEPGVNASDWAVALAGSFAWQRVGVASADGRGLSLQAHGGGLPRVALACSAPPAPRVAGVLRPGHLANATCGADGDCASGMCSGCSGDARCSCHACSGDRPPGCAPGSEDGVAKGCGVCTAPADAPSPGGLPFYGASLGAGAVGFTTHAPAGSGGGGGGAQPALQPIQQRVAAKRAALEQHDARFGGAPEQRELTEALTAALSWRHVWTGGAEDGPVLPMTYGFSWITPAKHGASDDWKYVLFCWDNIFSSYAAGALGYREAAYSNLIQIVKAKSRDGFVPNWAAGGNKNTVSEPAVGGRVLLDLYRRFGDAWLVELLLDDLLDWSDWQWTRRRTVSARTGGEPGFLTIGNDYAECGAASGNCPGGGESGLDQSPKWDCPGAAADGSGGDCSVFENKTGCGGPNPSHVLQLGDTQATSLFVHDALSLAALCAAVPNRSDDRALLLRRAALMQAQLAKLWDPAQRFFADRYVATGAFSSVLTPTAAYPLLGGATAVTAAQAAATVAHLGNASELCVAAGFARDNPPHCYWGLPSVSAADRAFMQPPAYVYWRGNAWGPMAMLTYWALAEYAKEGAAADAIVRPTMEALAAQKQAQLLWHWREHRHICENYSPFDPASPTAPGDGQVNTECTGWQFYSWGALNGVPALLELQSAQEAGQAGGARGDQRSTAGVDGL